MARNLRQKSERREKETSFYSPPPLGDLRDKLHVFKHAGYQREERLEKLRSFAETLVLQLFLASPDSEKS